MRQGIKIVEKVDTVEIERALLKDGLMQVVDFATISKFTQNEVTVFCLNNAIYQIITTELLEFVKAEIGDLKAIEIGAGNGCLGRSLGITLTDNHMQRWPAIKAYYDLAQQPTIKYPSDVKEYEALKAIGMFSPQVVVGSWVTQKWKSHFPDSMGSNMYGVDEAAFKGKVQKYILIGNEKTHGDKEILNMFPYKKYQFPWLVSRSMDRANNLIYVFDCK